METYNELLKQFHEETAPKDFLGHYKSFLDELQLARTRRKHDMHLKTAELKHLQQEEPHSLSMSTVSFSIVEDSRLASSRLDGESAGQRQLRREQVELEREIESLKAKTIEITSELRIYRSKETLVSEVSVGGGFAVLRQWQQVDDEASLISKGELREQQILHDLKTRKEQLSEEIQRLIKGKQATDQLLKRWRRSKQARVDTVKEQDGETDLQDVLRIFHFLSGVADEYERNTGVSAEELKMRYECHEDFKGSKGDLIRFYQQKGKFYDEAATNALIGFYQQLEVELDRNERAHQQATETLSNLETSHDKLNNNIKKIHERKQRCTIHALRKYSQDIQALQEKLAGTCDRITKLTTALYQLLRRISGFFKTAERVMEKSEAGRRILRELPDCEVLGRFEELLFRNPEQQLLEWSSHQLYGQISINSLLRLYASPKTLSHSLDALDNYQKIAVVAFKNAQEFPAEMFRLIKEYLKIANCGQKSSTSSVPEQGYCVESKEYYRRDNFKLLERLESEELKRKGLLMRIPINLVADTEISDPEHSKPFTSTRSLTPRPSLLTHQNMKYTDLASKRQQNSLRKQKIRKLLGRLDSVSRSTSRLPVNLNPNLNCSRISFKQNSASLSYLQDRLRPQRNTVGVLSKLNCTTEGFS